MNGDATRFGLRDGLELAGLSFEELWLRYMALGGSSDLALLVAEFAGAPCGAHEHNLIAHALNEAFLDQGIDTFPVAYFNAQPLSSAPSVPAECPGAGGNAAAVRRDAAAARQRSAAAARKAAMLHSVASQLMQASGQLHFARHAHNRAVAAQQRSVSRPAA